MFCFRNKFAVGGVRLGIAKAKWEFATGDKPVYIKSAKDNEVIKDAEQLVLVGKGYGTEDEALTEGIRWRDRLQIALAHLGGGADFGDRKTRSGGFSNHVKKNVLEKTGQILINERPGLQVFECDPMPIMARMSGVGVVTYNETRTHEVLQTVSRVDIECGDAERLAFDLYSSSFFQPSSDAKFVTLMMAIETLLDVRSRPKEARNHVDELIRLTRDAEIDPQERESMLGALHSCAMSLSGGLVAV